MSRSAIRFGLESYPDPEEPYKNSALRSRQIKKELSKPSLRKVPSEILKISCNGKSTGSRERFDADISKNNVMRQLDLDSLQDENRPDHLTKNAPSDTGDSLKAQDNQTSAILQKSSSFNDGDEFRPTARFSKGEMQELLNGKLGGEPTETQVPSGATSRVPSSQTMIS